MILLLFFYQIQQHKQNCFHYTPYRFFVPGNVRLTNDGNIPHVDDAKPTGKLGLLSSNLLSISADIL